MYWPERSTTTVSRLAVVGSLLCLPVCLRSQGSSQAVGVLARHMAKPSMEHGTAAKAVLQCIAGTLSCGITLRQTDITVGGYNHANHAGDSNTRRSTARLIFILNGGANSWSSRLQPMMAVSITEAEYMSVGQTNQGGTMAQKAAG